MPSALASLQISEIRKNRKTQETQRSGPPGGVARMCAASRPNTPSLPSDPRRGNTRRMIYAHARGRYLAAIGLGGLGAAFAVAGCHGSSEPITTPPPPPTTATATATAQGTGTPAPATHHTTAWVPSVEEEKQRPGIGICPHGPFCVPQPASAGDSSAQALHPTCNSSVPLPAGIGPTAAPGGRVPTVAFDSARTATERASDPTACCYRWNVLCVGGRALRGAEGPVTAAKAQRRDWLAAEGAVEVEGIAPAVLEMLAAHWAREAAFEHASVASFARASLALMAVGAPPELVAATHEAAIDEIEHARLTYALASAYGGAAQGPGPLELAGVMGGAMTLASVAVETFLDACAGESAAALALREAAAGAEDPAVSAVLARIADDEESHAELAWRTVAWALRAGGDEVARGIAAALEHLREEVAEVAAGTGTGTEALARYGVLGEGAQRAIRRRAIVEVVLPCGEALLAR